MIEKAIQEYNPKQIVVVVGYPKSGNTLLSGLLGEALDCPVVGYKGALPIAIEGLDRTGWFRVTQLHLTPTDDEHPHALVNAWEFATRAYSKERVVHIVRDARDIATSAKFYWDIESISKTIEIMRDGEFPLTGVRSWNNFVTKWLAIEQQLSRYVRVRYEDLVSDPIKQITNIMLCLELPLSDSVDMQNVISERKIDKRREFMEKNGDSYMWGKGGQLKLLRKGVPGDWVNYFTQDDLVKSLLYFGDTMRKLGYEV